MGKKKNRNRRNARKCNNRNLLFFEGTGTNVGERLIELVHYCAQKLMQKDIKDEEKANFEKYLKEPIEEGLKYMICEYCNDDRANLKKIIENI